MSDRVELVWDESGLFWHFICDKLKTNLGYKQGAFGFFYKGELIAALGVYDLREDKGVRQANLAGVSDNARWFTRRTMADVCAMLFNPAPHGMGLTRLNSFVDESNDHSVQITKRVGFTVEGRMRKAAGDGGDVIVFGMLPEECPWLHPQEDDRPRGRGDNPAKI